MSSKKKFDLFGNTVEDTVKKKKAPKPPYTGATCQTCGKPISDPLSVEARKGPVCLHREYLSGQKDHKSDLFILDHNNGMRRKVASFDLEIIEGGYLVIDRDDDEGLPSVTNSIDDILAMLELDPKKDKVVCYGSDHVYTRYTGKWKFLGKDKNEAVASVVKVKKEGK